ncbi:MAG: DUF4136 domain-containing protein [Parasphingorhabdus sp.]|uniref:DUF4136 domain-containing protein n=1 Tax=Parasphingorhabdus sp. TaxID=2709688 RepID=UPI0030021822
MRKFSAALVVGSLFLAGCATTGRITTDSDPSQNFAAYRTFAWAGEEPMVSFGNRNIPAIVQSRVAQSIKSELTARGYQFTDDVKAADFAVSFTIGTRDGTKTTEIPDYFWQNRLDWAWGNPHFPTIQRNITPTRTVVRDYTEGTLSVDIYDVARRSPVWHGKGTKTLSSRELSGEQETAAADVRVILAKFPPQ